MLEFNSIFSVWLDVATIILLASQQLVFRIGSRRRSLPRELSDRIASLYGSLRLPKQTQLEAEASS